MKLLHYSTDPFLFDPLRKYDSDHWKPAGLWVSVEGEDDWPSWCEQADFGLYRLSFAAEVILRPNARVLLIDSTAKLDDFNRRFQITNNRHSLINLDWAAVKAVFDGVIIAPYQWKRRLELMWYYGWDCASGVIWKLDAIEVNILKP